MNPSKALGPLTALGQNLLIAVREQGSPWTPLTWTAGSAWRKPQRDWTFTVTFWPCWKKCPHR